MATFKLVIFLLIVGSLVISGELINDSGNQTRIVRQSDYNESSVSPLKRLFKNRALNIDDQLMEQLQFSLYLMYWKLFEANSSARRETSTKMDSNNGLEKRMNENLSET